MPEIIQLQNSLSPKELFNEYSKNQPAIVSSSIANNDENVDPDIKELIINFDRKMIVGKNGINYGSLGEQHFPKTISAKWNKETEDQWIIKIELEPDKEYSMVFPGAFYFDKDGNNLKETYYLNFKTRKK